MKDQKLQKTNVYRLLDQAGAVYTQHYYGDTEAVSGTEVAEALHEDPDRVFKTLVTAGRSGEHYGFMIPVAEELDLRKAAAAAGEKSVGMIKARELLPLTGYIHGGCSPIGMKKQFATFVDETAVLYDTVFFSAGKIGYQVEMSVSDLEAVIPLKYADLTEERR
jgi:Cys-tRNA(Pro)/Cys-tRNA(Cys) deacylase